MVLENGNTAIENNNFRKDKDSVRIQVDSVQPKWLNKCFVQSHLQNYFNSESLKVVRFSAESATAKGENYASDLYRVKVAFKDASTGLTANSEVN